MYTWRLDGPEFGSKPCSPDDKAESFEIFVYHCLRWITTDERHPTYAEAEARLEFYREAYTDYEIRTSDQLAGAQGQSRLVYNGNV